MEDRYSNGNQAIMGKFVNREVLACVTSEVEFILAQDSDAAPFRQDDVENSYSAYCEDCGMGNADFEIVEDEGGNTTYKCKSCGKVYTEEEHDALDTEAAEVYEWWLVTDWLYEKLKERGEVVVESWNYYWGRQCSGQAILLDPVIWEICHGMEILEGQQYEWKL